MQYYCRANKTISIVKHNVIENTNAHINRNVHTMSLLCQ